MIASLGYLAIQIRQNTRPIRQNIEVGLFKLYEKGLVDPENWENIVESQLDVWWSNPHRMAYIRSRPGPISRRFAAYLERRLAKQEPGSRSITASRDSPLPSARAGAPGR